MGPCPAAATAAAAGTAIGLLPRLLAAAAAAVVLNHGELLHSIWRRRRGRAGRELLSNPVKLLPDAVADAHEPREAPRDEPHRGIHRRHDRVQAQTTLEIYAAPATRAAGGAT